MVFFIFSFFLIIYIIAGKRKNGKIPYWLILNRVMRNLATLCADALV